MRAVLTYHSIDDSGSPVSVAPATFVRQMDWLARQGPPVLPLAELLALPDGGEGVALTFDDAFLNFAEVAQPVLTERGLPATLFVVTGHVGGTNAWGGRTHPGIPTLPLMDWDALGLAAEAGVDIGGHTRTHPRLPELSATERLDEVRGCADDLERRLGRRPRTFSYPYGATDPPTVGAVEGAFAQAVTTDLRWLAAVDSPHRIPRLDMYYLRKPGRLERWGSPSFRFHVRARRLFRAARQGVLLGP